MAITQYNYSQDVNSSKLSTEINQSLVITTALDRIYSPSAGNTEVYFKDALANAEETDLNAILSAHDNTLTDEQEPQLVLIQEEFSNQKTGGHFGGVTFAMDVPASSPVGDWTEHTPPSFKVPVTLNVGKFTTNMINQGDLFEFIVNPEGIIGTITQNVAIGDTEIFVSQSVLDNTALGFEILLDDGTNKETLGVVVEKTSTSIKLETATTFTFATATPTHVKQNVYMTKMWEFAKVDMAVLDVLGESVIGGSYVPANTPFLMRYQNNQGALKRFVVAIEYKY